MSEASETPKPKSGIIIAAIIAAVATVMAALITIFPDIWKPLPDEINIAAHVSDLSTGESIQGAKIILLTEGNSYVDFSDSNGNHTFRVEAARRSNARLFVEVPGYEIYETSVSLSKDQPVNLKLVSKDSDNHKIIVRVVDDNSSIPVEGAKVLFVANGENYSNTTDSNGIAIFTIEFTNETIDVDISVSTADHEIDRQQVTVRPDQVQDIRLNSSSNELSVVPFESSENSSSGPTGNAITYDQIVSGTIDEATQKNRYTFTGSSDDVILISIAKEEGELFPEAILLDPEGKEIRRVKSIGPSKDMNITLPITGEYIILVDDGFDGLQTGQYILNLQKIK